MKELRPALVALLAFTLLTGIAYPAVVMAIGQLAFPRQAAGDPLLVGQAFADPRDVWSRPSATGPTPYNAMTSSGANQAMSNPALHHAVAQRIAALRAADPGNSAPVPADLVTASGSGLDPHVSPAAAYYQAGRVARARRVREDDVRAVIADHVEPRTLGILGEPRVNVVALNRALDARFGAPR
jgi:potassium-transporting ATPase KdpC subunit